MIARFLKKLFGAQEPTPRKVRSPRHLARFLDRMPPELRIAKDGFAEWSAHPCMTAHQIELLREIDSIWNEILDAKTWEQFLDLRGAYRGLVRLIELPENIALGDRSDATAPDVLDETEQHLRSFINGTE